MSEKKLNKEEIQEKKQLVQDLTKQMQKLNELDSIEKFIKDNKIKFEYKDSVYRVRKPNFSEREQIRKARTKKYIELLEEDGYIFKKQLVKKLKIKGIDIPKMEQEIGTLQQEIDDIRERLAQIEDKKTQKNLKEDIYSLLEKQQELSVEITDCLQPCIENELDEQVELYTVYTLLEKQEGDKWIKAFDSFDSFKNMNDEELMATAAYYSSLILFSRKVSENDSE